MTFQIEFPDFDPATLPAIPASFEDTSWHNDACPSFISKKLSLVIYVDFINVKDRELGEDSDRFVVQALDADGCLTGEMPLIATNDWNEVLTFIATREA